MRIDSTVVDADVKYPTDAGAGVGAVTSLAREWRKLAALVEENRRWVRDRSQAPTCARFSGASSALWSG